MLKKQPRKKPSKPRPDFPLFAHDTRRWAKKIRGKLHYFGPWEYPDKALRQYLDQKDYLQVGRKPPNPNDARLQLGDLCNSFLAYKEGLVETGELSMRTYSSYKACTDHLVKYWGRDRIVEDIDAQAFADLRQYLAKVGGLVTLGNLVQRTRIVLRFAYEAGLIDKPIRVKLTFKRPTKAKIRAEKQKSQKKLFARYQIRWLLLDASPKIKAMILLGINCGFGQTDCSTIPVSAIDLRGGWVTFPRPKTAVERRCKLWPETVEALRIVVESRKIPDDPKLADRFFLTRDGLEYVRINPNGTNLDGISLEFNKLRAKFDLVGRHLAFYTLRHTFETIAGETEKQIVVDFIMGHAPASDDMSAEYRKLIKDERIEAVTDYVRGWLFPAAAVHQ